MNRHQLEALARGTVAVLGGVAILYAIGRYLGWWVLGAVVITCIGSAAWDACRRPGWWRLW